MKYYEEMGLITSTRSDDYAYRLYDEAAVQRLEQILILRKLNISIKDIQRIFNTSGAESKMQMKLWYKTPPKEWMEGLPIGNGRLAAMIWGDADGDRVSLNHVIPSGRDAAKKLYGCRGVWFPIQTDAWGKATPEAHG